MDPLVSVLIPTYNEIRLEKAVSSIVRNSFKDLEIVVIDDGSDPEYQDTLARIEKWPRVKVLRQNHANQAVALNRGLREARGVLVARQDADDISHEDRIGKQARFLIEHKFDGVSCQFDYLLESPPHPGRWVLPTDPEEIARRILAGNVVGGGYFMARRSALRETGPWTWTYPRCEDWEFWIRFIRVHGFKFGMVDEVLYYIHWKQEQSNDPAHQALVKESARRVRRDYAYLGQEAHR